MKCYVQTTPWHEERYAQAVSIGETLYEQGADAELLLDDRSEEERKLEPTGFTTFVAGLAKVEQPGAWFIEDDAILTSRFVTKASWEVGKRPDVILQGYSTEKDDVSRGERYRRPSSFGSNLCVWYPEHIASLIARWAQDWRHPTKPHRHKDDLVKAYLTYVGLRYFQLIPNLATPRAGFSVRQGRRFAQAESFTWEP